MAEIDNLKLLFDRINWNLLETEGIFKKSDAENIIKLYEIDPAAFILRLYTLIEKSIEFIYTRKFKNKTQNTMNPLSNMINLLQDVLSIPQTIIIYTNSIRMARNRAAHGFTSNSKEDIEEDTDTLINMSIHVFGWFYDHVLLLEFSNVESAKTTKQEVKSTKFCDELLKLTGIKVNNLFGEFNYSFDLDFSQNKPIIILFGNNGAGKTTILELISNLANGLIGSIIKSKFEKLIYKFVPLRGSNKSTYEIQIEKTDRQNTISNIKFHIINYALDSKNVCSFESYNEDFFKVLFGDLPELKKKRENINENYWNAKLNLIQHSFPKYYEETKNNRATLEKLYQIIHNFDCFYIPAQRLQVSLDDLNRLVKKVKNIDNYSQGSLEELKKEILNDIIRYKIQVFRKLYKNIPQKHKDLFFKIINTLFFQKTLSYDDDKGLFIAKSNQENIPLFSLSSGEKNLFILFFDTIFSSNKESLILIDEPEISLHAMWQFKFLELLSSIQSEKKNHFLIATHSPQIVKDSLDLCIEMDQVE